ncbi:S41 family peptidase [Filimonas effusa]|uniref:PDZ domain-containing protein n=1 Tax=Filimonas effusa TaxID=2508721 RepID=A0A4Q1D5U5_9BACT|nr:S41 family peptidase [Filimonas effusa]RXK83839.1 hypothetical protein ESB13_17365 [Filimonas effusa]
MKNLCLALLWLTLVTPFHSRAQSFSKVAGEAFLVYRMIDKFHVEPRTLNDSFSHDLWFTMLKLADEDELFFSDDDITRLRAFESTLDDEIRNRRSAYISLFTSLFIQRLKQADSLVAVLCSSGNNTTGTQRVQPKPQTIKPVATPGSADITALRNRLQVYIKEQGSCSRLRRQINYILRNAATSAVAIGDLYCEAIARCFDPHTGYFPLSAKENFESQLGKQRFRFGFRIKEEKDDIFIEDLQPGSPAYKSGQLQKGDKIIQAQWSGNKTDAVSPTATEELNDLLRMSNHDTLLLRVRKANGSVIQVPLLKEQATDAEVENKVKSFVLKGQQTIGYIYLPTFYEDWDQGNIGLKGCANDVAREIVKLKKENITGLILDLRFNGGGSVQEAMELTGIFIDAGPVAQIKRKDPKPIVLYDVNRGTAFDGPLVVLVNSYSASASELVAAALQDYNRAVIVGTTTYGKATGQVMLPVDTTISLESPEPRPGASPDNNSYIKITMSKLFRVNGSSLQATGVIPSVIVKDSLVHIEREADEPFALKATTIAPNKYYKPYPVLPAIDARMINTTAAFTITNHEAEKSLLQSDAYGSQLNEAFKTLLASDTGVKAAYEVLQLLIKK